MNRPPCPACNGTRTMGNKHPRPCTCCDDGYMRGVTDETPEELRIADLTALAERLERENAELRAMYEAEKCKSLSDLTTRFRCTVQLPEEQNGAASDSRGGGR